MSKFIVSLHQPGTYIAGEAVVYTLHESGSGNSDFISNGIVKLEENKAGTFEFDILPSNSYYSVLRRYVQYVSVKEIDNNDLEEIIFYGRILTMSLSFNGMKHVTCEGLLANLLDCPVYSPQNLAGAPSAARIFTMSGTPYYMLLDAISAYRNSIRQDIEFGHMDVNPDVSEYDDIDVSGGTSVGNFIMNELVEVHGGFLRMAYTEKENGDIIGTIYWEKDPSMAGYDEETINQEIKLGLNLLDMTAEFGSDEIMSGIVPMWIDSNGDTKWSTTTAEDVDDSTRTVYKPVMIGSAGGLGAVGIQVVNIPGVTTQETATAYATGYVDKYCQYNLSLAGFDSYTVRALDFHYINTESTDRITLYKRVRILSDPGPYSIDETLVCTQAEINIDSPEVSSYTFSVFRPKASSSDKVLTRQLEKASAGLTIVSGGGGESYVNADNISY